MLLLTRTQIRATKWGRRGKGTLISVGHDWAESVWESIWYCLCLWQWQASGKGHVCVCSLSCWLVDKNTKIEYLMRMNSWNLPTSQVGYEAQNTWKFPVVSKDMHLLSCSVMSDSLRPHGLQPARYRCSRRFSRQDYWSGLPMPSSRGSSQPRDRTQVSRIAGGFFTSLSHHIWHWGEKKT